MASNMPFFRFYVLICIFAIAECHNKYSKDANFHNKPQTNVNTSQDTFKPGDDLRPITLRHLDRPFRMAKLNLLWSKAIYRLTDSKLTSIFGELKLHDKEEITWKHLRAEGKDKDGLKEAQLRDKLKMIMTNYGLLDQMDDMDNDQKVHPYKALNEASDKHVNKSLFKDKKLNKLWEKAVMAGFSKAELSALHEEFQHHQDKIDQYYSLLYKVKGDPNEQIEEREQNSLDESLDKYNQIEVLEEKQPNKDYLDKVNLIRDQHRQLKDGYDHLDKLASSGPASKEFVEPKVQGLWRIALESNFSTAELQSLKAELLHYENRLLKLRHMQVEHAINEEKHNKKQKFSGEKSHGHKMMEDNIKKHARKVDKIHLDIETKIMQKHIEL
ncbi:alpha-2-macroglobulin receptor-associated protein [Euwallacea fornicatus]|uniref:alpha-2-macroglobulin receptor-associated protein n=1 Tax=Euwallacea fornicatus TaxID=995702 RepID=UPI00338D91E5